MKRPICGSPTCDECMRATLRFLTPPRSRSGVSLDGAPTPTAASLKRHLERYGDPDKVGAANAADTIRAVGEVAAEFGIAIKLPRVTRARGVSRPNLKARIRSQLERGTGWNEIMEIENLSPSRARRLRMELDEIES